MNILLNKGDLNRPSIKSNKGEKPVVANEDNYVFDSGVIT